MELKTRKIGRTIVELNIEANDTSITVDVCDLNGIVDQLLIDNLKELVEELEEHNETLKNK